MDHRSRSLVGMLVLLVLAGTFAVADPIDGSGATRPSANCAGRGCTVGEVESVLAVQDPNFSTLFFEGVAVGRNGVVYTSEQCTGKVYRTRPDGRRTVIATIPYGVENDPGCNMAGILGLAVSDDGDLWAVVLSWLPESHGVWRIRRNGSAELAIPLSPTDVVIPNAIVFDPAGNLYVTDSAAGAIWKAGSDGVAALWFQCDELAPATWIGANGVAYGHGALYVANTDKGTVVKVPLHRDGSPGEPEVIATGLNGPDGMAFDAFGDLYLVTAYGAQLVRIRPHRSPEVVVDLGAAGVAYPTSVDLGKTAREMTTAYVANMIPLPGQPNLVKVNLCERRR